MIMTNLSEVMPSLPPVGTPRFGILVLHWKPPEKNKNTDQQIENIDDIHRIKVEATIVHG